jgi:hypothetical protein
LARHRRGHQHRRNASWSAGTAPERMAIVARGMSRARTRGRPASAKAIRPCGTKLGDSLIAYALL